MRPPIWSPLPNLKKLDSLISYTPQYPSPHPKTIGIKYEWDVPYSIYQNTPLSRPDPLRTETSLLWAGMTTYGTLIDYVTGMPGLGEILRESKAKKNPDAPTSVADLPGGAKANATKSPTTLAGGESALVDLDLIPSFARKVIPQLNFTSDFPPSLFTHGMADPAVLVDETIRTYDQLKKLGVEVQMVLTTDADAGGGHMFEWGRTDLPAVKMVMDDVSRFLVKHLE